MLVLATCAGASPHTPPAPQLFVVKNPVHGCGARICRIVEWCGRRAVDAGYRPAMSKFLSSIHSGPRVSYSRLSGIERPERLESAEDKTPQDWSADGKFLIYSVLRANSTRELWILPLAGSQHTPVCLNDVPYRQNAAAIAPDSHSWFTLHRRRVGWTSNISTCSGWRTTRKLPGPDLASCFSC
jgi:hypothetical protein